ncbi:MAG: PAS domain S-box protein [Anaerolineae bacterium]|nr:PAS domain S-box protein [Anaerolineae bacterium]
MDPGWQTNIEQEQAKGCRRARQRLLTRIVAESLNEVYVFDAASLRFCYANRAALHNLGYTMRQMRTLTPLDLKPEFDPPRFETLLTPLRDGSQPVQVFETIHRRKDGSTYPVEVHLQYLGDETPPLFVAIILDISVRRAAEEALRQSWQFVDTLLDCLGEGVIVYDRHLRYKMWNRYMEEMTGVPASQVVGKCPWETFPFLKDYGAEGLLRRALAGEVVQTPEMRYVIPHSGKSGWNVSIYTPLRTAQGEIDGVVAAVRDTTAYHQMQAQLQENEKMASLGTLAAGIAHEINTPLQIITTASERLLSELAKGTLDLVRQQRYLQSISENAWRVARIVSAVRSYVAPGLPSLTPCDLNQAVHEALLMVENRIKALPVQLEVHLAQELPPVECDRAQVIRALLHLLTNAVDAMPRGGQLTVRSSFDTQSQQVLLSIEDSGEGIPPHLLGRIFDPFFTTKPLGKGDGLELSVVRGILKAHGGSAEVYSEPGKGARFTLRFPLHPPQTPHTDAATTAGRFGEEM